MALIGRLNIKENCILEQMMENSREASGTYDGTTLVADIGSNVYLETVFDDKLFFSASGFTSGSADGGNMGV